MERKLRIALRWMHIVFALVLMCYVYSPFHEFRWFQILTKFMVVPVATITGIWIWKFKAVNKALGVKRLSESGKN